MKEDNTKMKLRVDSVDRILEEETSKLKKKLECQVDFEQQVKTLEWQVEVAKSESSHSASQVNFLNFQEPNITVRDSLYSYLANIIDGFLL